MKSKCWVFLGKDSNPALLKRKTLLSYECCAAKVGKQFDDENPALSLDSHTQLSIKKLPCKNL